MIKSREIQHNALWSINIPFYEDGWSWANRDTGEAFVIKASEEVSSALCGEDSKYTIYTITEAGQNRNETVYTGNASGVTRILFNKGLITTIPNNLINSVKAFITASLHNDNYYDMSNEILEGVFGEHKYYTQENFSQEDFSGYQVWKLWVEKVCTPTMILDMVKSCYTSMLLTLPIGDWDECDHPLWSEAKVEEETSRKERAKAKKIADAEAQIAVLAKIISDLQQ